MCVCGKLEQFFGLPSLQKGDRDGTETGPSYYLDTTSDKKKKEIQALTGRLATLNRFISLYPYRLQPFFKALKGTDVKGWGPECAEAFWAIK